MIVLLYLIFICFLEVSSTYNEIQKTVLSCISTRAAQYSKINRVINIVSIIVLNNSTFSNRNMFEWWNLAGWSVTRSYIPSGRLT